MKALTTEMSSLHLTTGSTLPSKLKGKSLRLYSMEFCPYSQRTRLVLLAKNLPHEIVNINLDNKPEWYFKIHPDGKVPLLDNDDEIIVESVQICDYLDEKYPNPPLYPTDPTAKLNDKDVIKKMSSITDAFVRLIYGLETKSAIEWSNDFSTSLQVFEDELKQRNTQFFYGNTPGMVDYMLWPWAERSKIVSLYLGERLFNVDQFPLLRNWKKLMSEQAVCKQIYHGPEKFWQLMQLKLNNKPVNYDAHL